VAFDASFFDDVLGAAQAPLQDFLQSTLRFNNPAGDQGFQLNFNDVTGIGSPFGGELRFNDPGAGYFDLTSSLLEQSRQTVFENLKPKPKPNQVQPSGQPNRAVPQYDKDQAGGISLSGLGPQNRMEFFRRAMQIAQVVETETGIPAELLVAMAANESNFGLARGNIMGGIKADPNDPNAVWHDTWEMVNGQRVNRREPFLPSATPLEGMQRVAQLLQSGRYAGSFNAFRQGQIDRDQFIRQVNAAGYATNPNWAVNEIIPLMREAAPFRGVVSSAAEAIAAEATSGPIGPGISQNELGLPPEIAAAFCGPAAAMLFAQRAGRMPTAIEALNLAKDVGWTTGAGMAGPQSTVNLLQRMGVPSSLGPVDPAKIASELAQGRPVIIDTPLHYYQVIGYNAQTGGFVFGDAVGRRAGPQGITLDRLASLNYGAPRTAIYLGLR
jgi:flagellum-specific peptidoglycan hydrolase FlgJ